MYNVGDKLSPTKEYATWLEVPEDSVYTVIRVLDSGMIHWEGPGLKPYGGFDGSSPRHIEMHMKPFQPISLENK